MKQPSRAWGFVRVGLNGSFGVLVPNFGTGGTEDNPLLNDVDAGDEAAGVEFCPVFAAQEASGTLTVRTDGSLSFVGAADGTYVIPYSLYTFTPGDSAVVDEGDTDVTVVVGAAVSLVIANALHAHVADNITLSLAGSEDLVVADTLHAHVVDSLVLSTTSALAVADALHAHTVDNLTLSLAGEANLVVADALHAHTVDAPVLSTEWLLAVADALHAHTADGVVLTVASVLAIQDALHAHTADNLTLTAENGVTLLVANALHAHTADGLALTVTAYLAVADALHVHRADNIRLTIPGQTQGLASWVFVVTPEDAVMFVGAEDGPISVPREADPAVVRE